MTYSTYEKYLMAALPLTGYYLSKAEMEYHGNFGHYIGQIQHISIMRRIGIYYTACRMVTKTLKPTIPVFQGLNHRIQYMANNPHKPIFYPSNYYDGSNFIRLT